ncbi:hypothetical protein ACFXGA_34425 [Actinosynnema sp. NPDC059335]|uniref:hypothetical protein n=1 Tax=Actinosynnema sp. NPDC059335 TaxID=3346804 RepID=UPI00366D2CE5
MTRPVGTGAAEGEPGRAGAGGGAERPRGWAHHLDALETEVYRTRRERRADEPKENTA